ncbi:MAG TPA: transcription-repair coupling factor [Candidatus Dormibacteraeota bacterium]|nr:transcription-repair coupling factor [Candidatus Dormibacteraeota bacterium]
MQKSGYAELLEIVAESEPIARKLRAIERVQWPVQFSHVVEPAQAFLLATIASKIDKTIWVVCPSVHSQELLYESLLNWQPDALFLPEAEFAAIENILPDPEIAAERLAVLTQLERQQSPQLIIVTRASLDQAAPRPSALQSALILLRPGTNEKMERILGQLAGAGYERVAQVTVRGQFAVRGGIVDLYSWQAPLPLRLEFFGDEIESLREFDVDTQTSVRDLNSADILLGAVDDGSNIVRDYLARDHFQIDIEPDKNSSAHIQISEAWIELGPEDFNGAFQDCEIGEFAIGDLMLMEAKRAQFAARLNVWRTNKAKIVIYFQTEGEIERFREIMGGKNALKDVDLVEGTLARGFCFPAANLVILSAAELFGRLATHGRRRLRRAQHHRAQIDFSELTEGDFVVHLEHGIGRFLGLQKFGRARPEHVLSAFEGGPPDNDEADHEYGEVLAIEFADEAKLYVPLEQAYLVSRYVGIGKKSPPLSSLGDAKWTRAKKNAAASIFDYAGKMLALQAERQTHAGHSFAPDTKWQSEFEHSFPFRETPDQLKAITDTKIDMERAQPMDRLICGDVGFGKTEVAIRAAFKAVMDGKQVAVLAPTTVLAQQHFEVFRQRMLDYPVRIEMLSRFRSQSEQKRILQLLREGGVDIVIGTHRLISGDVAFKDLGLAIIDEEQRFGVLHKEKFKEVFKLVDVLTLSATPIPRTLYLSLVGVKDMSTIETPPLNRLPVETVVSGYDERLIRDAISRELERQGQIFFLHNRVMTIERARDRIIDLCPQANVEIGHGQMDSDELEAVMARFISGRTDVLVCTTIIESGLDIPNANTIIIDRADRFGLADLYQLRGRVGRAEHKAYAYLLLPREMMTIGAARKRISAIKQYSSLGAGFRIAMRDLEIRGAGSILGTAQSGHIMAVGFDLYCQLLKQAIAQRKGEKVRLRLDVDLRLDFVATSEAEFVQARRGGLKSAATILRSRVLEERVPAFVPTSFIADPALRIRAYRDIAEITTDEQRERLARDWRDRFGPFPPAVDNLFVLIEIKLAAAKSGVSRVEVRERKLMLTRRGDFILVAGKFPRLVAAEIEQYLEEILELIKKL